MSAAADPMGTPGLVDLARISSTLLPSLGQLGMFGLAALAGAAACIWFGWRRRGLTSLATLARDERGAAMAADYILVAMPFLIFVTVMVQITWLMRETIILHYATYAAARSARVHLCPHLPDGPVSAYLQVEEVLCTNDRYRHVERSARFALVAASPPWNVPCLGACQVPQTAISEIARNTDTAGQRNAMLSQARWAYDGQNVHVAYVKDTLFALTSGNNPYAPGFRLPVTVRLTYRHYIITLVGPLLGVRRGDGYYFRETSAEVTLL
jgi:hypothetical protein